MPDSDFDPYYELLSIPPAEQPPNHYRLLGIALFEVNPQVISNAASRQITYVRQMGEDKYSDAAQRILDELARAKLCLLNEQKRQAYDAKLREALSSKPAEAESPPNSAPPAEDPTARDSRLTLLQQRVRSMIRMAQVDKERAALEATLADREWLIGSSASCEIVVENRAVSRVHCRLYRISGKLYVEDLKSTNGIYVNDQAISGRVEVSPNEKVTLGKKVPFPWPPECLNPRCHWIYVGRDPRNDYVLNDDSVSAYHARIMVQENSMEIEDLASSNGTSIGNPEQKIRRCQLQLDDVVYFGNRAVPVQDLLAGQTKILPSSR